MFDQYSPSLVRLVAPLPSSSPVSEPPMELPRLVSVSAGWPSWGLTWLSRVCYHGREDWMLRFRARSGFGWLLACRHCPHCHGWYHWYLWAGRFGPDRKRLEPEGSPVHRVYPAWCWSLCRSGWYGSWVSLFILKSLSSLVETNCWSHSFAIGIVGDAGVRGTAQQPRLYVGMILILIFAEVLGEFIPPGVWYSLMTF